MDSITVEVSGDAVILTREQAEFVRQILGDESIQYRASRLRYALRCAGVADIIGEQVAR